MKRRIPMPLEIGGRADKKQFIVEMLFYVVLKPNIWA